MLSSMFSLIFSLSLGFDFGTSGVRCCLATRKVPNDILFEADITWCVSIMHMDIDLFTWIAHNFPHNSDLLSSSNVGNKCQIYL